jgi:ABC-type transport system involved in cytochrome c biogenesis permease subunit
MSGLDGELRVLWAAAVVYVAAGTLAIFGVMLGRRPERAVLGLLVLALALHGASIALRWRRLGHGPFITLFEILSSNVWSLTFVFTLAYWRIRPLRPSAAVVVPILFVLLGWMLVSHPGRGFFPPTYDTVWLYVHVFLGKVFLGTVLVAVGLAGAILLRAVGWGGALRRMPDDRSLEELAYRFMGVGLIFDSLMLVAGAIWAQDAWGRYWAWDPLETWAFVTWLLLGFAIHTRITLRPRPAAAAALVCIVFGVAFLTFFGVPFVSRVPHQGAI